MKALRPLYVFWPLIFAVFTVVIASLYAPEKRAELLPFAFDAGRFAAMIFSWPMLLVVLPTTVGLVLAKRAWAADASFTLTDKMVMVWFLMNATWYHIGCDVMSGLFQVMPNLTEGYQAMNNTHFEAMHHPDRVLYDSIYWFELFVQMPLSYLTFWLYLKRSSARPGVEIFLCGLHLTGTVAYYLPNLILWHWDHPLMSALDRVIGSLWIWVPAALAIRAIRQTQAIAARAAAQPPTA